VCVCVDNKPDHVTDDGFRPFTSTMRVNMVREENPPFRADVQEKAVVEVIA